ncbi:hemerythrin [Sphingobium sp. SCG-1]|uniref:hemerythrin domain-containing protein n=1 Tax=Sphingobium sp. SCG-1 TaxID=2072936 RepID=UPI000CD6A7FD|nr:hemerythrin domain-containing protein [Sphingobium sp. SCG-1]AUW59814.1 hemerythrin [Sphingobium sp. SCG-1]
MAGADIFDALKQDHDQHRLLLDKLTDAKGENERCAKLFDQFRIEVTAHAAAEEETLYATMLSRPDLREDAQHSVSEHKEIDDYLDELNELEAGSDQWEATFEKMKKRYLHHIDEEEEEMFPDAAEELSSSEEKALADRFAERKPAELERAQAADE